MTVRARISDPGNWRNDKAILVPEAHSVASLGVIRSLGRAGYRVHALGTHPDSIGFRSRYAVKSVLKPNYGARGFGQWLMDYIRSESIAAILPVGILEATRPRFAELAPLMPIARDEEKVFRALTKFGVFEDLLESDQPELKANLPPTLLIDRERGLPSLGDVRALPPPYFIKVDSSLSTSRKPSAVVRAADAPTALEHIDRLSNDYSRFIVQGFVPGMGAAAAFVIWGGRVVADFMNVCNHETDGFCSLRQSWYHHRMREDALAKIRHIGWEGISMLEYRWDPATDRFYFIELNPRFWAALHVALYAGCDLPRYLFDAFFGDRNEIEQKYPLGVKSRLTFPFEIGYTLSQLRRPDLAWTRKAREALTFLALFADPRVKSDLFFPGDRALYLESIWRTAKQVAQGRH